MLSKMLSNPHLKLVTKLSKIKSNINQIIKKKSKKLSKISPKKSKTCPKLVKEFCDIALCHSVILCHSVTYCQFNPILNNVVAGVWGGGEKVVSRPLASALLTVQRKKPKFGTLCFVAEHKIKS